jgi:hypothetical protein
MDAKHRYPGIADDGTRGARQRAGAADRLQDSPPFCVCRR